MEKFKFEDNIYNYVETWADETPDKIAVYDGSVCLTWSELRDAMIKEPVKIGTWTALRARSKVSYIVKYLAAHKNGIVTVLLDGTEKPDDPIKDPDILQTLEDLNTAKDSDVLFTSGTTGKRKGCVYTRSGIVTCGIQEAESFKYSRDTVFITTGPLSHSGCWAKVLAWLVSGSVLYTLDGMANLGEFFSALEWSQKNIGMFLAPASIKILLTVCSKELGQYKYDISFIETGGAALKASDLKALKEILPRTRIYNTYGSTECGMVSTYDVSTYGFEEGCVGWPVRNCKILIDDDGKITVVNAGACDRYLGDTDSRIYIETSDEGLFDEYNQLHITGRSDAIINVGGFKVDPYEVESCAESVSGVSECVCLPKRHPVTGYSVVLKYTGDASVSDVKKHLSKNLASYKVPREIVKVDVIDRTESGKKIRTEIV